MRFGQVVLFSPSDKRKSFHQIRVTGRRADERKPPETPIISRYLKHDEAGNILNPDETLIPPPFIKNGGSEADEVVMEGTGAMRVYQEMSFGLFRNEPGAREKYRQLLLQYCELDSAAMVIIWTHWSQMTQ